MLRERGLNWDVYKECFKSDYYGLNNSHIGNGALCKVIFSMINSLILASLFSVLITPGAYQLLVFTARS